MTFDLVEIYVVGCGNIVVGCGNIALKCFHVDGFASYAHSGPLKNLSVKHRTRRDFYLPFPSLADIYLSEMGKIFFDVQI